jgi:hypothetical protein
MKLLLLPVFIGLIFLGSYLQTVEGAGSNPRSPTIARIIKTSHQSNSP